ncbi:MAG TPA: hypothetical protein VGH89_12305 [Pseudonocardia sp.]|jgi:hypothetical protein
MDVVWMRCLGRRVDHALAEPAPDQRAGLRHGFVTALCGLAVYPLGTASGQRPCCGRCRLLTDRARRRRARIEMASGPSMPEPFASFVESWRARWAVHEMPDDAPFADLRDPGPGRPAPWWRAEGQS